MTLSPTQTATTFQRPADSTDLTCVYFSGSSLDRVAPPAEPAPAPPLRR